MKKEFHTFVTNILKKSGFDEAYAYEESFAKAKL